MGIGQPQVEIARDVLVEMRDGVQLATDVYRPSGEASVPTLVHRLPYGKSNASSVGNTVFNPIQVVEWGYAVVVQDCRGRFGSEGDWHPIQNEANDGYDTIEWVADQSWCNGRVGIYGSSYHGHTSWQAAIADPPHLEAVLASFTGGNYHDGSTYTGGAFELGSNMVWILYYMVSETLNRLDPENDSIEDIRDAVAYARSNPRETIELLPLNDMIPFDEHIAPYWQDWLTHPTYDEYWETIDVTKHVGNLSVPVLHVAGWYDLLLRGHLDVYEAIVQHADPTVAENQYLRIGPWDHGAYKSSIPFSAGERIFTSDAVSGTSLMLRIGRPWFDHWLRDADTDISEWSSVKYYMMGTNTWNEEESWPPSHTQQRWHLHSGGEANSRFGDGRLSTKEPYDSEPSDTYEYDPLNPVPSTGGRTIMPPFGDAGVQDQRELEERQDVLVYTSSPLNSRVPIAGPVTVTLFAASSTVDTDFTAKLVDVEPDGYCAPITEGIIRGKYRNSMSQEDLLEPGTVHEFEIDLAHVAHSFEQGHRIQVEISSSNFPRFDRNLNTTKSFAAATKDDAKIAVQHVFHGTDYSSHISLPVKN